MMDTPIFLRRTGVAHTTSGVSFLWFVILCISITPSLMLAVPERLNLFNPYERLLLPPAVYTPCNEIVVFYEHSLESIGYQADPFDDRGNMVRESFCRDVNPLQLWNDNQNLAAAFLGGIPGSRIAQIAQELNINATNAAGGLYRATGDVSAQQGTIGLRHRVGNYYSVGLYIPIYELRVRNVKWTRLPVAPYYEALKNIDFIQLIQDNTCAYLGDWNHRGIGDMMALWMFDRRFLQRGSHLHAVDTNLRLGAQLPTGRRNLQEDKLLRFPFGYDSSWGVSMGGGLDLYFGCYTRIGLDIDLLTMLGHVRDRFVQTDMAQTDLVLATKIPCYRNPGFRQQFTVHAELHDSQEWIRARCAYQFIRMHDSTLIPCVTSVDPVIADAAESLQEWTLHSLIFLVSMSAPIRSVTPTFTLFYKRSINGERAVGLDTAGLSIALDF